MVTVMESRHERVLIIDDDAATTQTFAVILRLEGYQVRTAITANDGLREVSQFHPDAIIVDLVDGKIASWREYFDLGSSVEAPGQP